MSTMPAQMTTFEAARLAALPAPHGTGAGYNSGCRCESCRSANAARGRAKRARRRAVRAAEASAEAPPPLDTRLQRSQADAPRAGPDDPNLPVPTGYPPPRSGGTLVMALAVALIVAGLVLAVWLRGQDLPPPYGWRPRY